MAAAGRLRVTGGEARGRRLRAPAGAATRPMTDRVREAVFSMLGARVVGARVLDLYAGSGVLAVEALSRGAETAVLVDRSAGALDAIRSNFATVGYEARGEVVRADVAAFAGRPAPAAPFDIVFVDPPYGLPDDDLAGVLERLARPGWLTATAAVVCSRATKSGVPPVPAGWRVTWQREYGGTLVVVFGPADDAVEDAAEDVADAADDAATAGAPEPQPPTA